MCHHLESWRCMILGCLRHLQSSQVAIYCCSGDRLGLGRSGVVEVLPGGRNTSFAYLALSDVFEWSAANLFQSAVGADLLMVEWISAVVPIEFLLAISYHRLGCNDIPTMLKAGFFCPPWLLSIFSWQSVQPFQLNHWIGGKGGLGCGVQSPNL